MNFYTTGEVAKKLNMSVRTLRYYDQIELLVPGKKDMSGKRYYSDEDLFTLEKIKILKMLKLPLDDIKQVLRKVTIEQLLQAHRDSLKQKAEELDYSIKSTNSLLNALHLEGELNWKQLTSLIPKSEKESNADKQWDRYFDKQEQAALKERLPKLERNGPNLRKWVNLIRRVELCLEKGESPKARAGQIIAEDALMLSDELFAGNEELSNKFYTIRMSKEKSDAMQLYPVKEEVLEFLEAAIQAYEENVAEM